MVLLFGVRNRGKTRLAVKILYVLSIIIITLIQQGLGALATGTMLGAAQTEQKDKFSAKQFAI